MSEEAAIRVVAGRPIERAKNRRRTAIINAARDLMRESGEAGLSMRALAARANVSVPTPYNLFGSKQEILKALLNFGYEEFEQVFVKNAPGNKLSRIFKFISLSFEWFRSDSDYYQSLLASMYKAEDADSRRELHEPGKKFLEGVLIAAADDGAFSSTIDIKRYCDHLAALYYHYIQEWVHGMCSIDEAEVETLFGFCCILLSISSTKSKYSLTKLRNSLPRRIAT